MKVIPLTQGYVAWVDDADYPELVQHKWSATTRGTVAYAVRNRRETNGTIYMHREIMGNPLGIQVDHKRHWKDQKIVDNRKSNLRLAPGRANQQSIRKRSDSKHSIFKGVRKQMVGKPWQAFICADKQRRHLGSFWEEGYAALLYDLTAVATFGEFAITNFPVPGSSNWIFGSEETPRG